MALNINTANPHISRFTNTYAQNYTGISFSIKQTTDTFNKTITDIKRRLNDLQIANDSTSIKRDVRNLLEARDVCLTAIAAYDQFLADNPGERFLRNATKSIISSPVSKAKAILEDCNQCIDKLYQHCDAKMISELSSEEFLQQAHLNTAMGILRACAVQQSKDITYTTRDSLEDSAPSNIYIARENGDVFAAAINTPVDEVEDINSNKLNIYKATKFSIAASSEEALLISSYKANADKSHSNAIRLANIALVNSNPIPLKKGFEVAVQYPTRITIEQHTYEFNPIVNFQSYAVAQLKASYKRADEERKKHELKLL